MEREESSLRDTSSTAGGVERPVDQRERREEREKHVECGDLPQLGSGNTETQRLLLQR